MAGRDEDAPGQLLHQACLWNNYSFLKDLLMGSERENVNALDAAGRSVVYTAVSNGSRECLIILLEAGADPNVKCDKYDGMTPLHQASLDGKLDMIRILLNHHANYNMVDGSGLLPIDLASRNKHKDCEELLRNVATERKSSSAEALRQILQNIAECDIGECNNLAEQLDASQVADEVNRQLDRDKRTPLFSACRLRRPDMVRWLIDHGAQADFDKASQQTPLDIACRNCCIESVRILLDRFPQLVTIATTEQMGCVHVLHSAANFGDVELIKLLLEYPYPKSLMTYYATSDKKYCYRAAFDFNVCNHISAFTPLLLATFNSTEMMKYLLEFKVTGYSLRSSYSELSALDLPQAKIEDYIDDSKKPVKINPVNPSHAGKDSKAPLHIAIERGIYDDVKLLIDHGADVDQTYEDQTEQSPRKKTPLTMAIEEGNKEIISLLLKKGVRDENKGLTICLLQSNYDLVQFLLKHKAHTDTQHKLVMPHHKRSANTAHQTPMDEGDGVVTRNGVHVNWRNLSLAGKIHENWIEECSHYINPQLDRKLSLSTITSIDVTNCNLSSFPPLMFKLNFLVVLRAAQNHIHELPDSYDWNLPNLKEVYLDKNKFQFIDPAIFQLPNLVKLSLCGNRIESVDFGMWTCPKLEEDSFKRAGLDISLSQSVMTDSFMAMSVTEASTPTLSSAANAVAGQTSKYPVAAVHMWSTSLMVVDDIDPVNPEDTLKILNLSHNEIKSIPVGLPCLAPNLRKLDLSYNRLKSMGLITNYPNSLINLDLSNNSIKNMAVCGDLDVDIPRQGSSSSLLAYACLSPNRKQSRLSVPSLSNGDINGSRGRSSSNSLSSLQSTCMHKFPRLENLETLNLSENKILSKLIFTMDEEDLPAETSDKSRMAALEQSLIYPQLSVLYLASNAISDIPKSISAHSQLSHLILRDNKKLRTLPPEMGLLKVWNLDLRGCPLEGPLAAMVEKQSKTSDILGFLKSVLNDAKPYATMKLMIVGQANIGKTTLLAALRKEGRSTNPFKTFTQRVNNEQVAGDSRKGDTVSTVGVDIGDLIFDKENDKRMTRGRVTFKTWDFGGQEEYYATHQYFLSKRSLYLVVWKLTDGEAAMENIKQWLVNIQTRSPDSPVVIVGTHVDEIKKLPDYHIRLQQLHQMIIDRFRNVEAKTSGFPKVEAVIEVSARPKQYYNIRELVYKIYETAWEIKAPGSNTMLMLEQKIPAIYIELEKVVGELAHERKDLKLDPVLKTAEYRDLVTSHMKSNRFRDIDELNQATQFLHDNGVLLHYQDSALNDLYFLDPQWLCDLLAHVVTIREVNPFVKNGIMRTEHLHHLFSRSALFKSDDLRSYIISLMGKFEMALLWDNENLLIPSLLPCSVEKHRNGSVKIPVCKSSSMTRKVTMNSLRKKYVKRAPSLVLAQEQLQTLSIGESTFYAMQTTPNESHSSSNGVQHKPTSHSKNSYRRRMKLAELERYQTRAFNCTINNRKYLISSKPHQSIRRLYLLAYIPSGFWPRLISRIYGDETISALTEFIFDLPEDSSSSHFQSRKLRSWQCSKTGLSLQYMSSDLLKVHQVHYNSTQDETLYSADMVLAGTSERLQTENVSILEVEIPDNVMELSTGSQNGPECFKTRIDVRAQLLVRIVYQIETLLEDWYPDLGDKGAQNTRGMYLVSRLIPCPSCIETWYSWCTKHYFEPPSPSSDVYDGMVIVQKPPSLTCYSFEDSQVAMHNSEELQCECHGPLDMTLYAPDMIFADVRLTLHSNEVTITRILGKGAYGVVFAGQLQRQSEQRVLDVAIKSLQPVEPGVQASQSVRENYRQLKAKWDNHPRLEAFTAYSNARQEISILSMIRSERIIRLEGVLINPLSLVLELAPHGSLHDALQSYSVEGLRLPLSTLQKIIQQAAEALEYLHHSNIIYRDLKAENILVWSLPTPRSSGSSNTVNVKLADFGVSRALGYAGAKGESGTPGYMAPEIIEFKGTEEYTKQSDCYSFGMLIYELITLKRPFHTLDNVLNINNYVLAGKRPAITRKELGLPSHVLDLMVKCWDQDSKKRPTAKQIHDVSHLREFVQLQQVVQSDAPMTVCHSCIATKSQQFDMTTSMMDMSFEERNGYEVFVGGGMRENRQGFLERFMYDSNGVFVTSQSLDLRQDSSVIVYCCAVENRCWVADENGYVHMYELDDDGNYIRNDSFLVSSPVHHGYIKAMLYVDYVVRVYVLLQKGCVVEYNSDSGYKISEMTTFSSLESSCLIHTGNSFWVGQKEGKITVMPKFDLMSSDQKCTIDDWMSSDHCLQTTLNHFNSDEPYVDTAILVTDGESRVWSYVYPGTTIYEWNSKNKQIVKSFDTMQLSPESEIPKQGWTMSLDLTQSQVTAMCFQDYLIVIGLTSGCVATLNAKNFEVVTCLRPHLAEPYYVAAIHPLSGTSKYLTVGRGFTDPVARVTDSPQAMNDDRENKPVCLISWYSDINKAA